jgi:hypothetical protein
VLWLNSIPEECQHRGPGCTCLQGLGCYMNQTNLLRMCGMVVSQHRLNQGSKDRFLLPSSKLLGYRLCVTTEVF